MTPQKFVIVLNKRYELPTMASAIGHVAAGLAASCPESLLQFVTYRDADGQEYPSISHWPFLILRAGSGQLANLRGNLESSNLPVVCYLDTMFAGGSDAQQAATASRASSEIEIVALGTFGEVSAIDEWTRKLSLWR
jgi:hypothetical protein